jgi:Holliday junction resolvase RusA-like endonuclease
MVNANIRPSRIDEHGWTASESQNSRVRHSFYLVHAGGDRDYLGLFVTEVHITVPLTPPSVNHYKMKDRRGHWYVKAEATAFKECVCLLGKQVRGVLVSRRYELEVTIYLGAGQRGDGDNFWKVIADGLVEAGVIHSDAAVDDWILHKRRDSKSPRTEITVRGL